MVSKKKNSIFSFESVLVSQIPPCKQVFSGLRAGSIKRTKRVVQKESMQKTSENWLDELKGKSPRDYLRTHVYKGRTRRPLSVFHESSGGHLQVAYYNFLPYLDENNSRNPSPKQRKNNGYVRENKYLHKFFDKGEKSIIVNGFGKSITVKKVMKCPDGNNESASPYETTIDKVSIPKNDISEAEGCLLKEYIHLIKPRFHD